MDTISDVIQQRNWFWWTGEPMPEDIRAQDVVPFLERMGLMSCSGALPPSAAVQGSTPFNSCTFFHPLVRPLLLDHLPPTRGRTERSYWSDVGLVPPTAYNAAALAQDYNERITEPALRVAQLLAERPYLTRLFTTISPDEMTVDPEFHERGDLPNVDNTSQVATSTRRCDGFTTVRLPDGREVELPPDMTTTWPDFGGGMPWAEKVVDLGDPASALVLADRSTAAAGTLSGWNRRRQAPPAERLGQCACAVPSPGAAWGTLLLGVALVSIRRRR